ncbi:MAG: peptide deformylase [Rikenellaceae bacterium]|nr:peptide deformylase [Rikenellaceae bacterium]
MIYPIYIYGSPVLREQTKPIEANSPELKQLVSDMFDTMYAANGVGLAAPQIGRSIRLFVIDATPYAEDHPELADFKKAFINAEIYQRSETTVSMEEGCLSFPKLYENVSRPQTIGIRYRDENGVEHDDQYQYGGMAARIIQHEYDHIEGIVFVDHLSPLRKTLLSSKLNGFTKGKFKAAYKCKTQK